MRVVIAAPVDLPQLGRLLDPGGADRLSPGLGGSWASALVAAVAAAGHEVTLVTLCPLTRQVERRRFGPVDLLVGPYRARHRARDAFRQERRAVREMVDSVDADVVHAHWTYEFGLGSLAARHPVLVTVHDWAPAILRHKPDGYRAVRMLMQARCLARSRHLTVVSPTMGERLRRVGLRATLVPNGLPTADLAAPRQWGSEARRVLCVTSSFSPLKNTASLLRAFPEVRRRCKGVTLHLVGPEHGPGGPAESWARGHGLDQGVVFEGPLPTEGVRAAMDAADLFVSPSLEESFGLAVLEAMGRGLPVVGGRGAGAVPWLLGHGGAGELVDVRRPSLLAAAVSGLVRDPERRERLGRAALARARQEFGLAGVVARYEAEYRRVSGTA